MGNGSAGAAKSSGFWQVACVVSMLVALIAFVLANSFYRDVSDLRAHGDQSAQLVAAAKEERDQAKAKADAATATLTAATTERDQSKAKVAELTAQLAASSKERDQLKAEVAAAKKSAHP